MDSVIFGVDSRLESNTVLTNGFQVYDWVVRKNRYPQFWGRQICGDYRISREEIDFLHGKNCKIAMLYSGVTEHSACTQYGAEDGVKAIHAAQDMGAPEAQGLAIFAQLRPDWQVWENWIYGYAHTLWNAGYIPGFMANTDCSKNFSFDRSYNRFLQMIAEEEPIHSLVWASEPKQPEYPDVWKPFCPSDITPADIVLWQSDVIYYNDFVINVDFLRDETLVDHFW